MSDIYSMLPDLPSFFDQTKKTPGSLTNEELQMRRKLAYAMASRNRPYPKTIGEGLTALGEAWGQRGRWQELDEAEAAQRARSAATQKILGGDVSYPTLDTGDTAAPPVTQQPVVPPAPAGGAPVVPPVAPPVAAPPGAAPGGAAPVIPPAPSLTPRRTPAPDIRNNLAQAMTQEKLAPEGLVPGGAPIVPGSVQLASLQPPNEPAPRSPVAAGTVPASVPSTVPTGAAPEEAPQAGAMSIDEWKARVARNESGGKADPYQAIGVLSRRGDRPYGKYQVMGNNVLKWSEQYLGQSMTPQEFLNNPKAQEAIADARGSEYISKYGPEGAAKAWFAGERGMKKPNSRDSFGTSVSEYAHRFNQPLVDRNQIAQSSLANGPSSSLASEEDARLADVTGQAAIAPPRVQLASLARNEPVSDAGAAMPTMGGVADAGIANAVTDRRGQIAEAVAQQRVAQAGGGATAPVASPPPASQAPAAVPPSAAPLVPPQAIPKAPETPYEPPAPGPQPTLQGILDRNPAYKDRMLQMRKIMADPRQTDADRAMAGKIYTDMETRANDAAKNQWTIWHEKTTKQEAHKAGKEKQDIEIAKLRGEAEDAAEKRIIVQRMGGQEPQKVFDELNKSKEEVQSGVRLINMNQMALQAINDGVITGWGAKFRIDANRFASWAANNGMSGDLAANSQVLQAALKSAVGLAVREIQGGSSANVSNTDRIAAERASGGDPTLELSAIKRILHQGNRLAVNKLDDYEDRIKYYLGGTRAERQYQMPSTDFYPKTYVDKLLSNPSADDKRQFDTRFGEGAADLEISRHKRRSR